MGDLGFSAPPNQEPQVPAGSDSFDTPLANFRLIGQMLASGAKDVAGAVSGVADWLGLIPKLLAAILGWILGKLLFIVAYLIGLLNDMYEGADPGIDAVARRSLEHVFGIPAGGSEPRRLAAGTDTAGAAAALGRSITDALVIGAQSSAGGSLQPSSIAAQNFLGKLARIGIEGWVEGVIPELLTVGQFKGVMELTPIMADILGLGRLSRRVLAPPLKILVEDPYTWLLNNQYRPTLLAHDQATRQFLRGRMSRTELDTELGRQGFSASAIEALVNINSQHLPIGDIDYLVARGHWSIDQGVQALKDQGWDATTAQTALALTEQKRIDAHNQTLLDAVIAAYERGEIDAGQLHAAISQSGLPDGEQAVLEAVEVTRRQLNVRHLTLGEVETLIKAHVMSLDDLRVWMTRENYPDDEQTLLEVWLFGKIQTADAAAAAKQATATAKAATAAQKAATAAQKAADAAAKLATKGVSVATFEQLVTLGQRTFADYTAFLTGQGLPASSVQALTDLLHAKITAKQQAADQAAAIRAEADVRHVPLTQLEKAVQAGTLSIVDLESFMQKNEFAPSEIDVIVKLNQAELDRAKAKAAAKTGATAAAGAKGISLPNLERAARLGLVTPAAYGQALTDAGFDAASRDLMVGILNDQIAADKAALDKRTAAAAAAKTKKISLAQLEQAVIDGIRPMTDYTAELVSLGYDATDVASITALLQLRVDNAKAVEHKKTMAAAKLAEKNLSLAEIERAVKLGVLSIGQYRSELAGLGFAADDIDILAASLLAEVAKTAAAQQKQQAAANTLAQKQVSLAAEDQLVLNGIVTVASYAGYLTAAGFNATDVSDLTALEQLKLDQHNAAVAKQALAAQRAGDKDISLAKEEQAVIDGVRTMDDYQVLLADLGFDATDQATLVDLLSQKVGAAVAKAAAAAPTSAQFTPAP